MFTLIGNELSQAKEKAEAERKEREEKERAARLENGDDKENQNQPGFDGRWYTDINER